MLLKLGYLNRRRKTVKCVYPQSLAKLVWIQNTQLKLNKKGFKKKKTFEKLNFKHLSFLFFSTVTKLLKNIYTGVQ